MTEQQSPEDKVVRVVRRRREKLRLGRCGARYEGAYSL